MDFHFSEARNGNGNETPGQGTGRQGGGLTGRAVAVVDAPGYLVRFRILPARAHGLTGVPGLPGGPASGDFVGERASGADLPRGDLAGRGAEEVIPSRRSRKVPRPHDRDIHGWRHPVESLFAGTGELRATATRHDRTDVSFAAGIHPVAGVGAAT